MSREVQDQAACKDVRPGVDFFRNENESRGETAAQFIQRSEILKQICAGCAIEVACRDYAIEQNIATGVWGGMLPSERREVRRGRAY